MLGVMNSGPTEMSHAGDHNAIFLNCWEKPSPLIKELERTVNFAERKCGDLMQQLHFYKEYYKKWVHTENINNICSKKKMKKCCRQTLDGGGFFENEPKKINEYFYKKIKNKITEVNNTITEANRKLYYKNENEKEISAEKELREENFGGNSVQTKVVENKYSKSEPVVTLSNHATQECRVVDCLDSRKTSKVDKKHSSTSMPTRKKKESVHLRRRYSNLQRYKIRSKSLPQGVRRKFGFGGFFEVFDPESAHDEGSKLTASKTEIFKNFKTLKDNEKNRDFKKHSSRFSLFSKKSLKSGTTLLRSRSRSKSDVKSNLQFRENRPCKDANFEPNHTNENNKIVCPKSQCSSLSQKLKNGSSYCKDIVPSGTSFDLKAIDACSKLEDNFNQTLSRITAKPNSLVPFLRQPIPFIPCSSTSKSFNLGLNIQQVLSLIKQKRYSVNLQSIVKSSMRSTHMIRGKAEPQVNTLFFSQTTTSHGHVTPAICPARECSEDSFSVLTETAGSRSKCSILKQMQSTRVRTSEEGRADAFVGRDAEPESEIGETVKFERPEDVWVVDQPDPTLRKVQTRCTCFPSKHCVDYHKVLRQYTGWRLPKAEAFVSESQSYNISSKAKLYEESSRRNFNCDPRENEGRIELVKVHNDLINLNRKYSLLQEHISQSNFVDHETNAELEAIESELAVRELEFKDILNFYNQLMLLKEKLKTLRLKSGQSQSTMQPTQSNYQRPKKDPLRPTPSMALTKVLRKIQGLQDKIKLIDAP